MIRSRAFCVLTLLGALAAVHVPMRSPPFAAAAPPRAVTVFAAASLSDAFRELATVFRAKHPAHDVRFNFAGSQQLATQIEQGPAADVFASADVRWMEYITSRGLSAGTPQQFAANKLVVILPRANPAHIAKLQDLARRGIKLVVGAEAVPVGKYSREVIDKLSHAPGFPSDFTTRVLANVVSQEDNVRAVAAKVELGEADAGIVYRSDVGPAVARKVRAIEIPDRYNVIAAYPIVVLRDASNAAGARAFVDFVCSRAGQEILARHGFLHATDVR